MLRNLPEAIGPAHIVCVAGVGSSDSVPFDLVAAMVADLDPDNVFWFTSQGDGVDTEQILAIAPNIHVIDGGLPAALASHDKATPPTEPRRKVLENRVSRQRSVVDSAY